MASPSLNKVYLIGNLTADPDTRTTHGGAQVCTFNIAINEGARENPIVTFVKITAWHKTAETCGRYLKKGAGVLIEGRLHFDSWEDRQTGERRQMLDVTAQSVQFMSRPRTQEGEDQDNYSGYQEQQQQAQPPQRSSGGIDPSSEYAQPPMPPEDEDDGEIPF